MNKFFIEDIKRVSDYAIRKGFENKSFLVSGATGMIGKILIDVLLKVTSPSKIIVMGKDIQECETVYSGVGVKYASFETFNSINEDVDYIIHLASPTASSFLASYPVEVIDFMYQSTKMLLDFAKEHKSSMIFASSMEVFGEVNDETKRKENDLGFVSLESTRSSYPETKRLCELLVRSYAEEFGLNCFSARLAQTFGAGTSLDDPRIFGYIARCILNNENIVLKTKGDSVGNYCYIADTLSAFFAILVNGKKGETYNVVGDNTRYTIFEMSKLVCEQISNNKIDVVIDLCPNTIYPKPTKLNMDNCKLKSLGWKPKYSLIDMYRRMLGIDA